MPTSTPPQPSTPTRPEPTSPELAQFAAALAGQYTVEHEIGRGGMGIVYRARDVRLDRLVAIKTLPPHLAGDPVIRERFVREARTVAALSHQHIVPIHRADELSGHVFFVMGFIDGESMAQRIRARGRLPAHEVVHALRDISDALAYAHARGVIHRDIKAENILLEHGSERALVTDFGIARLAEAAPLTATGQVLGTVYYTSPEQVSGEPVDARTDIYSLGVLAYLALSGRFPFDAELASAVLVAHVTRAPRPLREVSPNTPRALADIVDQCLAKDPARRPQRCADLLQALHAIPSEIDVRADADTRHASESSAPAPLVSDTEAHLILGRAADLQAMTGIQPRPLPEHGKRDPRQDAARTSGHRPAAIRDAAVEAGIDAKYVEHALVEHGLRQSAVTGSAPSGAVVNRSAEPNAFLGSPSRLEYEIVVDGEMPLEDFDLLLEIIRQSAGEAGEMATIGRSFSWQNHPDKGHVHVSVLPRGNRTTIRVSESLKAAAGGFFGGIMGGAGGGSTPVWLGVAIKMHSPLLGVALWSGAVSLTYLGARALFGMHNRYRGRKLRLLAERLASQVRESIDQATKKLPPSLSS